ncbi:MAG: hypothetical protein OXF75_06560 [Acidimicrobiaceae bacterium]|nr:hypothetical protein [Acidimicrobiaceae bacterium]
MESLDGNREIVEALEQSLDWMADDFRMVVSEMDYRVQRFDD